jgi:hypothetical protein
VRWFILVLIVANVGLYFWLQYDALPEEPVLALPPPDIGRLQLLKEGEPPPLPVVPAPGVPGDLAAGDSLPGESPLSDRSMLDPWVAQPDAPSAPPVAPTVIADTAPAAERSEPPAETVDAEPSVEPAAPLAEVADAARSGPPPLAGIADRAPAVEPMPPIDDSEPSPPGVDVTASRPVDDGSVDTSAPAALDTQPDVPAVEASIADAQTAREVEAAPPDPLAQGRESPEEAEAEPGPPPAVASCAQVGPLEPDAADQLIAGLPIYIELVSDATEEVVEIDSYYVMIPPLPSRSAGLKVLADLEAKGITDTWLFPRGVYRNAISLGLYSRESGALRHQRSVVEQGFDAEVVERTKRREVRRLLLKNVDGGAIGPLLPLPEGVAAESVVCP